MPWRFVKQSNGVSKVLREPDGVNVDVEADILRYQRDDGPVIGAGFFSGDKFENFSAVFSREACTSAMNDSDNSFVLPRFRPPPLKRGAGLLELMGPESNRTLPGPSSSSTRRRISALSCTRSVSVVR